MKRRAKYVLPIALVLLSFLTINGCAKRLPKPKTASGAIESYFKKYGKKHKASDFGQHEFDEVEITSIEELQHDMVYVQAFVSLGDGDIVYKVGATLLKKTLRWRVISWENLGRAS